MGRRRRQTRKNKCFGKKQRIVKALSFLMNTVSRVAAVALRYLHTKLIRASILESLTSPLQNP